VLGSQLSFHRILKGGICSNIYVKGAHGGAVCCGIVLQARRSWVRFLMVSLEFFIDIILLAALWPWG